MNGCNAPLFSEPSQNQGLITGQSHLLITSNATGNIIVRTLLNKSTDAKSNYSISKQPISEIELCSMNQLTFEQATTTACVLTDSQIMPMEHREMLPNTCELSQANNVSMST